MGPVPSYERSHLWRSLLRGRGGLTVALTIAVLAVLVVPSGLAVPPAGGTASSLATASSVPTPSGPLTSVPLGPYSSVQSGSVRLSTPPSTPLFVVLTLPLSNSTRLSQFLMELSTPKSPEYHHYLTEAQFVAQYAPSSGAWSSVMTALDAPGITNVTASPDRVTISFDITPAAADRWFHTTLASYVQGDRTYIAPSTTPELDRSLATEIAEVDGLSTYSHYELGLVGGDSASPVHRDLETSVAPTTATSGYPTPPSVDGIQFEYASDYQVAYDEQSLFDQYGYPTNATVATILWSGSYTGTSTVETSCGSLAPNTNVGPWVPSDIYSFYNETLPAGEPHASLTAVPIDGAPAPSCLASWDSSGANGENTLDLEMIGSTAPGARIFNVYGPSASLATIDAAFGTILSPPSTLPAATQAGLENVTVISNSWGGTDGNNTTWYQDLEQAQARGISVLASSGDSGSNPSSPRYEGSPVDFPASMAFDSFGVTAVGGTTVELSTSTLRIRTQSAWYDGLDDPDAGLPAGSTGGVSDVFAEPSWQSATSAAEVIADTGQLGRGVPDIAALANNTLLTLTVDDYQYKATNASVNGNDDWIYAWGTSIASPLTAGLVATIDHVLRSTNESALGFLNPEMYTVANEQYTALPTAFPGVGAEPTGSYDYSLPTAPFIDVTLGANYLYSALPGYDLVTGWGSLDAYNYTMYVVSTSFSDDYGHLSGVQDRFDLAGLSVTSTGPDSAYDASTQQNLFLANSLGAPIYWIQNVVYIEGSPGDWAMNFTGWVVFPFWATYPAETVYEYNWPASGLVETTPLDLNFTTTLSDPGGLGAVVDFSFGLDEVGTIALPVPGASFIIGSLNYTYSWQGVNYTNGGSAYAPGSGFLSPQFGLVGGPSGGLGDFMAPTAGTVSAWLEPWGTTTWQAAWTSTYGLDRTQTGEEAENLLYQQTQANNWSFSVVADSSTQGVLAYENPTPYEFTLEFNQTGVPADARWFVNVTGAADVSALGSQSNLTLPVLNGSYAWTAAVGKGNWSIAPDTGRSVVSGQTVYVDLLAAASPRYLVQFNATGVPPSQSWYVNITRTVSLSSPGSDDELATDLVNGTYAWTGAIGANWTSPSGDFRVNGASVLVDLAFALRTASVAFVESGLPSGTTWTVVISGAPELSGSTSTLAASLDYGDYRYEVSTANASFAPTTPSGSFDVPATATVDITFEAVTYGVVATATYTGGGTMPSWTLTIAGSSQTVSRTQILVELANGTYPYSVATVSGYTISPTGGSLTISGANATLAFTITKNSAPTPPTGTTNSELPTTFLLGIVGGLAVVVILVALVVLLARRRRKGGTPPPDTA